MRPDDKLATLAIGCRPAVPIRSTDELRAALETLGDLPMRNRVLLAKHRKHYIRAERWSGGWQVDVRKGGIWTLRTLTVGSTTDWSQKLVRDRRHAKTLWHFILNTAAPERSISTVQVERLFLEFYLDKELSLPAAGA